MKPAPWEKQPGESSTDFKYFCIYRDMGYERTLEKTYQQAGLKSMNSVAVRSTKHHWVARAAAWDNHLDGQRRKALEQAALKEYKNQLKKAEIRTKKLLSAIDQVDMNIPVDRWAKAGNEADLHLEHLYGGFDRFRAGGDTEGQARTEIETMTPEERREELQAIIREVQIELETSL
ncbi:hypothetical protein [Mobiluncus curtisii]|nr:hypothetical protein [Mobiluncus curtisii]